LQVGDVAVDGAFGDFQPFGQLARGDKPATAQVLNDLEKAVCTAHSVLFSVAISGFALFQITIRPAQILAQVFWQTVDDALCADKPAAFVLPALVFLQDCDQWCDCECHGENSLILGYAVSHTPPDSYLSGANPSFIIVPMERDRNVTPCSAVLPYS